MEGKTLGQALMKLSGHELRLVYAMLCRTNIGTVLTAKTKDLLSKEESAHFSEKLEREARLLAAESDEALRLSLFLELTKTAGLKGGRYDTPQGLEDQLDEIVGWAFRQFKKNNKEFGEYYRSHDFGKLEAMIQWQMNQIFHDLDLKLGDLSDSEQNKLADQVISFVDALPAEQQEQIKEKLGVQELSDKVVRKMVAQSGVSLLFATIVEVTGFAFYTSAASGLAALAGLFGVTLPFGAYTTLSSAIALLANPLFLLPLLAGGGAFLVSQQNRSLKKKLVPIVLMQITLPYLSSETIEYYDTGSLSAEWETYYERYSGLHVELAQLRQEQKTIETDLNILREMVRQAEQRQKQEAARMVQIRNGVKEQLKLDMNRLYIERWTEGLDDTVKEISRLQHDIIIENNRSGGFFGAIKRTLKTASLQTELKKAQKSKEQIFAEMAETVLRTKKAYAPDQSEQFERHEAKRDELIAESLSLNGKILETMHKLHDVKDHLSSVESSIQAMEKETYGLADLVMEERERLRI